MKVYGYEPTDEQLNKAMDYMKGMTSFKAKEIEGVLINEGVPEYEERNYRSFAFIAHRVTDRLIQKLRKAKKIELESFQKWKWVD